MSRCPISNLKRAIPAILFACFIYALLSVIVKQELSHLSVAGILIWRYAVSLILFIPWWAYQSRGQSLALQPSAFKLYGLRMGASLVSVYLYCAALKQLSVGMTALLYNTLPFFVPFIGWAWKKHPISYQLWWGLGIALLGMVLVLWPSVVHWNFYMLLAIAAGMFGAFSLVSIRFAHYEEPSYRINLYFFALALLATILVSFLDMENSYYALTVDDIFPLFLIGCIGLMYQQSFTYALKHAPTRFLAPFTYSTVIWGMLFDKWLWDKTITLFMLGGTVLIIIGNILVYILYPKKDF